MKNNIAVVITVPEIPTALAIPEEARIDTITGIHDAVVLVIVENEFNFNSGSSLWIVRLAVFEINPTVRKISATRHNTMYFLYGIFVPPIEITADTQIITKIDPTHAGNAGSNDEVVVYFFSGLIAWITILTTDTYSPMINNPIKHATM